MGEVNKELQETLERLREINEENERLAEKYEGKFAFVKSYTDACEMHPEYDKEDIEQVVYTIYERVKDVSERNVLIMQGRTNFVSFNKKKIITVFVKNGLFKKLHLAKWLDTLLNDIYTNLQLM